MYFFYIVTLKMPWKCCVGDCRSNYDTAKETTEVHSFPCNATECERRAKALPETPTKDKVVCVQHCPVNRKINKKERSSVTSRFTFYFLKSEIFCSWEFRCTTGKPWKKVSYLRVSVESYKTKWNTEWQSIIMRILRNLFQ